MGGAVGTGAVGAVADPAAPMADGDGLAWWWPAAAVVAGLVLVAFLVAPHPAVERDTGFGPYVKVQCVMSVAVSASGAEPGEPAPTIPCVAPGAWRMALLVAVLAVVATAFLSRRLRRRRAATIGLVLTAATALVVLFLPPFTRVSTVKYGAWHVDAEADNPRDADGPTPVVYHCPWLLGDEARCGPRTDVGPSGFAVLVGGLVLTGIATLVAPWFRRRRRSPANRVHASAWGPWGPGPADARDVESAAPVGPSRRWFPPSWVDVGAGLFCLVLVLALFPVFTTTAPVTDGARSSQADVVPTRCTLFFSTLVDPGRAPTGDLSTTSQSNDRSGIAPGSYENPCLLLATWHLTLIAAGAGLAVVGHRSTRRRQRWAARIGLVVVAVVAAVGAAATPLGGWQQGPPKFSDTGNAISDAVGDNPTSRSSPSQRWRCETVSDLPIDYTLDKHCGLERARDNDRQLRLTTGAAALAWSAVWLTGRSGRRPRQADDEAPAGEVVGAGPTPG